MMKMKKANGFTLIEIIIVIAVSAIIATGISLFLKNPVIAYDQTVKRAELADEAYLLTRKIKQDIRMSLPNSIRITTNGTKTYLEVLTVSGGGKYRSQLTSSGTGNILDFSMAETSFDVLSGAMTFNGGEKIAVANMGTTNYDAYAYNTMTNYTGVTGSPVTTISINSKQFPLQSVNENFYVVNNVVTYVCDTNLKTLKKYWGYTISASQPNNDLIIPLSSGSSGLLSKDVVGCSFIYNQGTNSRNGVVGIMLQLQNSSQTMTLYGDTYVPNM